MSRVENQMSLSPLGWRAQMDRKAAKPGQRLIGERYTHFLASRSLTHTKYAKYLKYSYHMVLGLGFNGVLSSLSH